MENARLNVAIRTINAVEHAVSGNTLTEDERELEIAAAVESLVRRLAALEHENRILKFKTS